MIRSDEMRIARLKKTVGRKKHTNHIGDERGVLAKYFATKKRSYVGTPAKSTVMSQLGRHKWHLDFLRAHRSEIKIFADVGSASSIGAPTTFAAKQALGKNSNVYAVDILKFDSDAAATLVKRLNSPSFTHVRGELKLAKPKYLLNPEDVIPVQLAISRRSLTYKGAVPLCDAIRFAVTSGYMTPEHVSASLKNISASLKQGGYLLSEDVILRKLPSGWRVVQRG